MIKELIDALEKAENSVPPLIDFDAVECANRIWALGTT